LSQLSVVLVHRDSNERAQLRAAFEAVGMIQIAGERPDQRGGFALARQIRPDILVLELDRRGQEETLTSAAQYHMENPEVSLFLTTDQLDSDILLRAMRTGAQDVLRRPFDRSALSAAIERVAALKTRKHGGPAGRTVVTVFSNKGGLGCTTIATNMALALRQITGREVALADLDYQSGDVAFLMGLDPHRSIADVADSARLDSASVQDSLAKHPSGVRVLPQPEQLDRAGDLKPGMVGGVVEVLSSMFDFVVLDAPHGFNDSTVELFDRSSTILLVTELSIPSARAARRAIEVFQRLNYLVTPDRVRPVVNRYLEPGPISLAQFEEALGMPIAARIANDYSAVSRAINLARPLCEDAPGSRATRDLMALARRVAGVASDLAEGDRVELKTESEMRRKASLWPFGKGKAA
jgi:pilus assembly protein CpaE